MSCIVGKENQTKCTSLKDKDLFQITLSCLPPNRYTVKRVGKYQRAVNLKKDIKRDMMSYSCKDTDYFADLRSNMINMIKTATLFIFSFSIILVLVPSPSSVERLELVFTCVVGFEATVIPGCQRKKETVAYVVSTKVVYETSISCFQENTKRQ